MLAHVIQAVIPEDDSAEPPMNDRKAFYADEEDQSDIDIDIASANIPNPVKSKTFVAPKHEVLNSIEEEQKHDNFFSINNQQQEEKQDDARDQQLSISSCSEYYEEENKS
jgi:hypothetical protein